MTLHISPLLRPGMLKDRFRVTRVAMTVMYIPYANNWATLVTLAFLCCVTRSAMVEISKENYRLCTFFRLAY